MSANQSFKQIARADLKRAFGERRNYAKAFYTGIRRRRKIYLNEEQSRHLAKSLRMKAGDMITVCSGTGEDYGCMIEEAGKDGVVLSVCYKKQARANRVLRFLFIRACPRAIKWKILFKMRGARHSRHYPHAHKAQREPPAGKAGGEKENKIFQNFSRGGAAKRQGHCAANKQNDFA